MPQLFGSVMPMQAWSQHSPSELSSAFAVQNDVIQDFTGCFATLSLNMTQKEKRRPEGLRVFIITFLFMR